MYPERMKQRAAERAGIYGSFDAYASGTDPHAIDRHVMTDLAYARIYAGGLMAHLRALRVPGPARILDVGCAIGTITAALADAVGDGAELCGVDLSSSAVEFARSRYPACRFEVCSADELEPFGPDAFDLIHVREFYPFSRTADAGLHLRFLAAFARALRPGGAVAAVQIVDRAGLADSLGELRRTAPALGYATVVRAAMVPQTLFRRIGRASYGPFVYPVLASGLALIEALRPGRVSYLYLFRKTG